MWSRLALLVCLTLVGLLGVGCESEDSEPSCIEDCGDGCPAPQSQPCASDGQRYCNACVIQCKGLTVVEESRCQ